MTYDLLLRADSDILESSQKDLKFIYIYADDLKILAKSSKSMFFDA